MRLLATIHTVPQCAVEGAVREGMGPATALGCSTLEPTAASWEANWRERERRRQLPVIIAKSTIVGGL